MPPTEGYGIGRCRLGIDTVTREGMSDVADVRAGPVDERAHPASSQAVTVRVVASNSERSATPSHGWP